MNHRIMKTALAGLVCLFAASSVALAEEAPNNALFAGAYLVSFNSKASDLSGAYTVPGLNASIPSLTTAYLAYTRRLTDHLDLELAAGEPPLTKTVGSGPAAVGSVPFNGQTLITAKWLSPAALIEYKFFEESAAFRPYVGVGVNHTIFYNRVVTPAGEQVTGGPTRLSLSPSTGIAATLGLSYRIDTNWYAHASYSVSNIHTNGVADTLGVIRSTHINFGPRAVVLAVGYAF
jgi:outer membrane protein